MYRSCGVRLLVLLRATELLGLLLPLRSDTATAHREREREGGGGGGGGEREGERRERKGGGGGGGGGGGERGRERVEASMPSIHAGSGAGAVECWLAGRGSARGWGHAMQAAEKADCSGRSARRVSSYTEAEGKMKKGAHMCTWLWSPGGRGFVAWG